MSTASRARRSFRRIIPGALITLSATAALALVLGAGHQLAPIICGGGPALLATPKLMALIAPWRLAAVWLLMLAAMTPALLVLPVRHIWDRSFADRRPATLTAFSVAYLGIWTLAGAPLIVLAFTIRAFGLVGWGVAAAIAVGWQVSPARQACLNRCHRRPALSASGARSLGDAATYGLTHGVWCIATCWPWMLTPLALPQHQLAAMAAATLYVAAERIEAPAPPHWGGRSSGRAVRTAAALVWRWTAAALVAQAAS